MPAIRWPRASYDVACFVGGCSFLGFYFLPSWLLRPLFFLTPVVGPLLLPAAGAMAMRHARAISDAPALRPGRLVAATAISCAILFLPVAALELILFGLLPYIGPLVVVLALPYHLVCVGVFAAGVHALFTAERDVARTARLVVPALVGLLAGVALTIVRFLVVPQSHGVFLEAFDDGSGSAVRLTVPPLDAHGQRDVAETTGVQPRGYHEPIAAMSDESLWLARRSTQPACPGYWIERRDFATGASGWRSCLATPPNLTRNPTAMSVDRNAGLFLVGFDVDGGRESWWLRRYDARGNPDTRWDTSFPARTKIDRAYGVRPAADGSAYVFGETGEIDRRGTFGWIVKLDPDGGAIREGSTRRFPNAGERRPTMAVVDAVETSAGDLYVLLNLYNAISVRKFDADGRELWQRELRGHDVAIAADHKGDLFAFGAADYPDRAWIEKLAGDGSPAWEKTFDVGHLSAALAVAFDRAQNVCVVGYATMPDDNTSKWWIVTLTQDGAEADRRWPSLAGPHADNMPFAVHRSEAGRLHVLGTGNGWQFSGSMLERWWGW